MTTRLIFLTGADMEPTALRAARPEARFVARAHLAGVPEPGAWGILVEAPLGADEAGMPLRVVVTDDGRALDAHAVAAPPADPAEVVAAARYWELPPAYVRSLPGWVDPAEPRYDLTPAGSGGSSDPSTPAADGAG